jgi:hypothetical protein
MPEFPAPQIQPASANAGGIPFQPIAYVDKAQAPAGLDVTLTLPGVIAPVGMVTIPPGCMIVVFPPEVADQIIRSVRMQLAQAEPGKIAPPGMRN